MAAERESVAPSSTTAFSTSSTASPFRNIVCILFSRYSGDKPNCSQRNALTLHPTFPLIQNPFCISCEKAGIRLSFTVNEICLGEEPSKRVFVLDLSLYAIYDFSFSE